MNYIQINPNHKDYEPIPEVRTRRSDLQIRMLVWKLRQNLRDITEGLDRLSSNYRAGREL